MYVNKITGSIIDLDRTSGVIVGIILHLPPLLLLVILGCRLVLDPEVLDNRRVLARLLPLLHLEALGRIILLAVLQHLQLVNVLEKLDVALHVARVKTGQLVFLLRLFQLLVVCLTRITPLLPWHLLDQF